MRSKSSRVTRSNGERSESLHSAQESVPSEAQEEPDANVKTGTEEKCPACIEDGGSSSTVKESWVRCDRCKTWLHWRCVGDGSELETIDKWFCQTCREEDPTRRVTLKPPARKSNRTRVRQDYASLHSGVQSAPDKWLLMLQGKAFKADPFKRMKGEDVNIEWLESEESAMTEPFVIERPDGLGMKMPEANLTVDGIADLVGRERSVEVMDVATQSSISGWDLGKWAEYYGTDAKERDRILNVISLEISNTPLSEQIVPPRFVRELDWVEKFWPHNKKGKGHLYPKVQLYCLMGVTDAWTDWHIDFAGSSVYYHIFRGSKVFYFIRPTAANLAAYERWCSTDLQNHTWLGDLVDVVYKVELFERNTMIIPTGWIHCVHTPKDSLVFGGNFLHCYNVATQIRVRDIEIATHVPKKFCYPHFTKLCWYVAEKCLRDMKAREDFSRRVLISLESLADYLVSEARAIERAGELPKKEAKESVPTEKVKDAPALVRELRWRVRLALHDSSDDEGPNNASRSARVSKRHPSGDLEENGATSQEIGPRRVRPKVWDGTQETMHEECGLVKPIASHSAGFEAGWTEQWLDTQDEYSGGPSASVDRRTVKTVRVRKIPGGVERQYIDRVVETWQWS